MNIDDLSPVLRQDEHGIWVSLHAAEISYPSDGNSRCFQVEDRSYWFEHRNNVISDVVRKYSRSVETEKLYFIDIGGGNGFVSARLAADGHDVVLLEPGPEGALNAKTQRNLSDVICATLQDAEIQSGSFDAAGAFDVIEHIEDDRAFVAEVATVVKPGGLFIATVPAHKWLWSNEDERAGHFRRYTKRSFEELMTPFFEPTVVTYLFQPLVFPILLLRALPSRFGLSKNSNTVSDSTEHGADGGIVSRVLRHALKDEASSIRSGKDVRTGSSVLFIGSKKWRTP